MAFKTTGRLPSVKQAARQAARGGKSTGGGLVKLKDRKEWALERSVESGSARVELPLPPSINSYWKPSIITHPKTGRQQAAIICTREAEKYKETVAAICHAKGLPILRGKVVLWVKVYCKRPNRDLSNCLKILEDSLNLILYVDDNQTTAIHMERMAMQAGDEDKVEVYVETVDIHDARKAERLRQRSGGDAQAGTN